MSTTGFTPDAIDGSKWDEEKSARMHFLKNRPAKPEIDGEPLVFPPYQYRPYPRAMYFMGAEPILVHSEREQAEREGDGWTTSAKDEDQRAAHDAYIDRTAFVPAAEQAHDHLKMSAKARAEFDAADRDNGDHPLVDLPTKKLDKQRGTRVAKG